MAVVYCGTEMYRVRESLHCVECNNEGFDSRRAHRLARSPIEVTRINVYVTVELECCLPSPGRSCFSLMDVQ